jgi:hypothetical protein
VPTTSHLKLWTATRPASACLSLDAPIICGILSAANVDILRIMDAIQRDPTERKRISAPVSDILSHTQPAWWLQAPHLSPDRMHSNSGSSQHWDSQHHNFPTSRSRVPNSRAGPAAIPSNQSCRHEPSVRVSPTVPSKSGYAKQDSPQLAKQDSRQCEACNEFHSGSYGSGRFCNMTCKNQHNANTNRTHTRDIKGAASALGRAPPGTGSTGKANKAKKRQQEQEEEDVGAVICRRYGSSDSWERYQSCQAMAEAKGIKSAYYIEVSITRRI